MSGRNQNESAALDEKPSRRVHHMKGYTMNRSSIGLAVALSCALALGACGGSDAAGEKNAADGRAEPADARKAGGNAAAADDGLGKLKCPAKVGKGLDGPDIIGLRLGMSRDEAVNVVRCHAEDAYVVFEDRWFDPYSFKTHQVKLEKQVIIAQSGETSPCNYSSFEGMQKCGLGQRAWDFVSERIKVAAPGLPGEERVAGVWRTQSYKEGATPAVETVVAALTKKYGPYQRRVVNRVNNNLWSNRIEIAWVSGVDGETMSEANPIFLNCAVNVRARVDDGQTWQDGCGLTIAVTLLTPRANPDVVGEFSVGMMNQSGLFAYQEELQMKLDDIETKRRSDELESARTSDVDL